MNKNYCFILAFFLFFISNILAQTKNDSVSIAIDFRWKSEKLELNKIYSSNNDTLQLSVVKFYLSNLEIEYKNNSIYKEKNSYHLIDIEDEKSLHFLVPKKSNEISKIKFTVGIDSTDSVSGALAGDLDLQNGMYWAWQSGYINMKIEGKSSSCNTRKNAFQFHIGGYLKPNYALRKVNINWNDNSNFKDKISLKVDVSKLFENIDLKKTNSIMIPGKEAMKMADQSIKMFAIE